MPTLQLAMTATLLLAAISGLQMTHAHRPLMRALASPPASIGEQGRPAESGGTRLSVVENWSAVCKDLCRAGLGGPGCRIEPFCADTRHPLPHLHDSTIGKRWLGNETHHICPKLCEKSLGGALCKCYLYEIAQPYGGAVTNTDVTSPNVVCDSFCDYRSLRLSGCTPCSGLPGGVSTTPKRENLTFGPTESTPTQTPASTQSTSAPIVSVTPTATANPPAVNDSSLSPTATSPTLPTTTTTTTTAATTTTTMTTMTTTAKATTTAPPTTAKTTTPNWDELCALLCREGQGGTLCNCDLPPFF